jgi:hypothetical protein
VVAFNFYLLSNGHNKAAEFIALNAGIALATLFRFWSYRKWVWAAPEDGTEAGASGPQAPAAPSPSMAAHLAGRQHAPAPNGDGHARGQNGDGHAPGQNGDGHAPGLLHANGHGGNGQSQGAHSGPSSRDGWER